MLLHGAQHSHIDLNKLNGGESFKVGEHLSCVYFEFEVYPEPKILTSEEIKQLAKTQGSTVALARFLGCSQAFVWERLTGCHRSAKHRA